MPSSTVARRRPRVPRDVFLVVVCLVLVLAGGLGSSAVQTAGGSIQVEGLKIPGPNGQTVAADLYKPVAATAESKVPLVVVTPGFQRTKETQVSNSLELARRGLAVIVVDPYNQGESSSQAPGDKSSALIPAIDYATRTSTLNYVDQDRIGITGHSAGGSQVRQAAVHYGKLEDKALKEAKDPASPGGSSVTPAERDHARSLNRIRSVYISGWLRNLDDDSFRGIHSNMGLGYARYDEGGYRNVNGDGDLSRSPEAAAFVNSGLPQEQRITSVEPGRAYGSVVDRTYRIANNDRTIHPFQPLSPAAVGGLMDFFTTTLDWKTDLDNSNQTWFLKELCNLISLIGALGMLVPLSRLLLRIPALRPAAQPVPPPQPPLDRSGRVLFWSTFVLAAAVACVSFIPLSDATEFVFPDATNSVNTWFFPARMVNGVLLWSLVNGVFGLLLFFGTHRLSRRRRPGTTSRSWGLAITGRDMLRTLLLALLLITAFYGLLAVVYGLFHSDYRFLVVAARPLSTRWFWIGLLYVPVLFVFFFSNSLRVNGSMRIAGQRPWVGYLLAALANSAGLAAIFVVQYVTFYTTGTVFWTDDWLYVNMLQSVLPMMIVLPLLNRAFFSVTGRVWLGPIVTVTIFALMSLGGSVAYVPLPH